MITFGSQVRTVVCFLSACVLRETVTSKGEELLVKGAIYHRDYKLREKESLSGVGVDLNNTRLYLF